MVFLLPFFKRSIIIFSITLCILNYLTSLKCIAYTKSEKSELNVLLEQLHTLIPDSKKISYKTKLVYQNDSVTDTISLFNAYIDNNHYQRTLFLDGAYREFLQKNNESIALHLTADQNNSIQKTQFHPSLFSFQLPLSMKNLESFYTITLQNDIRLSNRPCVQLDFIPIAEIPDRYRYLISIDNKTGLVFGIKIMEKKKTLPKHLNKNNDTYNSKKNKKWKLIENFFTVSFKEMVLNKASFDWPDSLPETAKKTEKKSIKSKFDSKKDWAPNGFNLKKSHYLEQTQTDYTVYSDDLSSFIVHLKKIEAHKILPNHINRYGSEILLARSIKANTNTYHLIIKGNIPLSTAKKIAIKIEKNLLSGSN